MSRRGRGSRRPRTAAPPARGSRLFLPSLAGVVVLLVAAGFGGGVLGAAACYRTGACEGRYDAAGLPFIAGGIGAAALPLLMVGWALLTARDPSPDRWRRNAAVLFALGATAVGAVVYAVVVGGVVAVVDRYVGWLATLLSVASLLLLPALGPSAGRLLRRVRPDLG